ncbi:DUF6059 family protein [Streptomyces sp. NPDC005963]|uniref:DUF6059 family protein n=1 Tax=Streptomyces sp. NPDC005963 TaxID=3156721 RepID=UPI0033CFB339
MAIPSGGRRSLGRGARWLGRFLMRGFASLAAMTGTLPANSFHAASQEWTAEDRAAASRGDEREQAAAARLVGPPPAHPERLVAEVPPSPCEQALWAQLEGPGRLP